MKKMTEQNLQIQKISISIYLYLYFITGVNHTNNKSNKTRKDLFLCEEWGDITPLSRCPCVACRLTPHNSRRDIYSKKRENQLLYPRLVTSRPPQCCCSSKNVCHQHMQMKRNHIWWWKQEGGLLESTDSSCLLHFSCRWQYRGTWIYARLCFHFWLLFPLLRAVFVRTI